MSGRVEPLIVEREGMWFHVDQAIISSSRLEEGIAFQISGKVNEKMSKSGTNERREREGERKLATQKVTGCWSVLRPIQTDSWPILCHCLSSAGYGRPPPTLPLSSHPLHPQERYHALEKGPPRKQEIFCAAI
ncbi:hypothetical protein ALC53_08618 [Atta colombica]|uniref:Uncharacterized protein n=1 Tax=Atta colombica TaxID=520822 RepID=A0A151I221_9HYME|nr:hypothetical protein ALC53_08618 [Atta colombica]